VKNGNRKIKIIKKIPFWKRKLRRLKFNKFGKRPRYGGTVSFGMSRGSIIKHIDFGLKRIGGFLTNSERVGLHEFNSYKRESSESPIVSTTTMGFSVRRS